MVNYDGLLYIFFQKPHLGTFEILADWVSDLFSESGQMVFFLRTCWLLFHFFPDLQALKTQWQLCFHFQEFQGRNLQWLNLCSAPSSQLIPSCSRSEELNFHKSCTLYTEGQLPQSNVLLYSAIIYGLNTAHTVKFSGTVQLVLVLSF